MTFRTYGMLLHAQEYVSEIVFRFAKHKDAAASSRGEFAEGRKALHYLQWEE